ncbi:MAG: glycosyltransferase family 4 protein [Actinomycetota bacterium]|nr:glycosyltransferase family 4 protein [Actinomycetota bacterium]
MAGELLVVSGEPLWPRTHGGRLRSARIVEVLAAEMAVRVVTPVEADPPAGVLVEPLPDEAPAGRLASVFGPSPRLGGSLLGPERVGRLLDVCSRQPPRIVLYTHSYLAEMAPDLGIPVAVTFTDVETRRMASLARTGPPRSRAAHLLEWAKARRWEPRVARRAAVSVAASPSDLAVLAAWGSHPVLVPNGGDRSDLGPSPARGPVTFVAGFGYQPNLDAARFLLEQVWPRLQGADPDLRLRLVGRRAARALAPWAGAHGADVVSDPDSVEPFYREASVILTPVRHGGGAQLKVTEALARGRVVVATPFSAAAAPPAARDGVLVADRANDFAGRILALWRDPPDRWARERALVHNSPVPTWEEACAPLVEALLRPAARPRR